MDIDLEAILRIFKSECDEHLVRMEEALIVLETDPADAKCLEAIFRGAHTIKGNAARLGLLKVGEFAHAFEELLQRLRNKVALVNKARITLLLQRRGRAPANDPRSDRRRGHALRRAPTLLAQLLDKSAPGAVGEIPALAPELNHPAARRGRLEDPPMRMERADTVRVDIHKLDHMLNLAGEIAVAHGRLRQALDPRLRQLATRSKPRRNWSVCQWICKSKS